MHGVTGTHPSGQAAAAGDPGSATCPVYASQARITQGAGGWGMDDARRGLKEGSVDDAYTARAKTCPNAYPSVAVSSTSVSRHTCNHWYFHPLVLKKNVGEWTLVLGIGPMLRRQFPSG